MIKLSDVRSKQQALPDLLPWGALIDSGVVLNKDGSLMAGYYYRGGDLATATIAERHQVVAMTNAALGMLGTGWMLHSDAVRLAARDYPDIAESDFPDEISYLIEMERHERFTGHHYFETIYVMFLTWLPPLNTHNRAIEMMIDDGGAETGNNQEQLVQQFQQAVEGFADRISSVLKIERLEDDAFLTALHRSVTGENYPVVVPSVPMYLDAVVGGHEFWSGLKPKVDNYFIQVVGIEGFPAESYPQILAALDSLPIQYRWSTRFIFQDTVESVGQLKKYRRKWQQKVRGFVSQIFKTSGGTIDQDALEMVGTTDTALSEASSGLVKYGYYTANVVVFSEDAGQLDQSAREVKRLINNLGFVARVETVNTVEAYLGTLPGDGIRNVRRPMMHTLNLADLLPLASVWPGLAYAPCPFYAEKSPPLMFAATEGSTPFRFNLHVGDLGHTLMIGPTGSGKSTALALIAAQFRRYKGASLFAFDKGRSLEVLTRAVGGQHFAVAGDAGESELNFAPLSKITDPAWFGPINDWCGYLFELQDLKLSPPQRSELHRALVSLRDGDGDRTLTTLQITIQDRDMKEALQPYTISGEMGAMLDSVEDGLSLSDWSCFEIEDLMNRSDRVRLPVLLYLFTAIERAMTGQPCLLILDEAWLMLGHPVFKEKLREWLKVLRKANCAVIVATQSLSDAVNSGILDVLTESCPTKIFLSNPEAHSEMNIPLYQGMGLNSAEIQAIAGMTPKREYFVKGEGRRIVDFAMGPIALAFVGNSDKESLKAVRELAYNNPEDWSYYWMQKLGVSYERFTSE